MRLSLPWLFVFLFSVSVVRSHGREKPWLEVRSQHFRALSDGSAEDARRVAYEFEQMRYVFATQQPDFRLDSGAPLVILAARDEATAKKLAPLMWKTKGAKPAGFFQHGWERQYAMVRLDTFGQGAREVVYHEYAHSILHMNSRWLPTWLDEGMAEFYAYTRFQQHEIFVGAPTERYVALTNKEFIPIETLISVNHASPYYHDPTKIDMFYAESWALVHYLIASPGMRGGAKLNQFFSLLQGGKKQKDAFQQVFGDFASMDKALDAYTRQFSFGAMKLTSPPQIDEKSFTSRTLSLAETDAELAAFHRLTHDREGAVNLVDEALTADPKLGLAHEEKGFQLFADGKDKEAAREFDQAYNLDEKLYLSLFDGTMLLSPTALDAPADQAALHNALLKVLDLNPQFAPAYVELARLAVRQDKLQLAFGLARRVEELEPSRAGYHLLTGQILLRMGKGTQAADFAKFVAERWIGADHDEAMELWNSVPIEQRPAGESLGQPLPDGVQTISGIVRSLSCETTDQPWSLVLDHDDRTLTFHRKGGFEAGFSDTIWYGEDHFTLCHHLEGLRAVVHYRAPSDAKYAGDLTEIEIRDDLPLRTAVKPATVTKSDPKS